MEEYKFILSDNEINLIKMINDIRKQNHFQELNYFKIEILTTFIFNPNFDLIIYKSENIFKLSENYYILNIQKMNFKIY